jgi:hypothetical protein
MKAGFDSPSGYNNLPIWQTSIVETGKTLGILRIGKVGQNTKFKEATK